MLTSGAGSGRLWWDINAALLLVFSFGLTSCATLAGASASSPDQGDIRVTVIDAQAKRLVHDVIVRVTGSSQSDGEDNDGFRVESCPSGQLIVAWAPGHQVGSTECDKNQIQKDYTVQLDSLGTFDDNPNYFWISAYSNCQSCHDGRYTAGYNEFNEWKSSSHATVFQTPYFATLYSGQTVECAFCHAPTTLLNGQPIADLKSLPFTDDVHNEGITCDVCHKVDAVYLENHEYPFAGQSGIRSFKFVRADQFTIGPFSNINLAGSSETKERSMCSRIFSKSEFCAACHYGTLGKELIYSSYKEWKGSSYAQNANSAQYRTCQDCHMSYMQNNQTYPFSKRSACSETDSGFQDFNHNVMDVGWDSKLQRNIPRMIRGAASIHAKFIYKPEENNVLQVHITVNNDRAGHKFPTDSPLRELILVLDAQDQFWDRLTQTGGDYIPTWGGIKNTGYQLDGVPTYEGQPGKIFANLILPANSQLDFSMAYWDPGTLSTNGSNTIDNRLEPGGKDESDYYFAPPPDGEVHFTISLIYRFGPYDLMQQKGWVPFMYDASTTNPERADIPVMILECTGNIEQADEIACQQTDP